MSSYAPPQQEHQSSRAARASSVRDEAEQRATAGEWGERLNQTPQVQAQRHLQQSLNESPKLARQAKLAQTLAGGRGVSQHKGFASGVIQRVPVSTGEILKFFDDEIPASLTLTGFLLQEEGQLAKYRVDATGREFYFNKATGRYFNLNLEPIDPRSLAPTETVTSGSPPDDGPSPGGQAIKQTTEIIKLINLATHRETPQPPLQLIRLSNFTVQALQGVIYGFLIPDLLQLTKEFLRRSAEPSPLQRTIVRLLLKTLGMLLSGGRLDNEQILWVLLDALKEMQNYLIANMPAHEPMDLQLMAYRDMMENSRAMTQSSYKQAINELGGEVEGSKIPVEERLRILQRGLELGFNFAGLLKSYKNYKVNSRGEQVDLAITEIKKNIQSKVETFGLVEQPKQGILKTMTQLKLSPQFFLQLISFMTAFGVSLGELNALVTKLANERKFFTGEQTLQAQQLYLLHAHLKQNLPQMLSIDPLSFRSTGGEYRRTGIDPLILASAQRAQRGGHTLKVNPYIERHFTPAVMKFLADHPSINIEIYEGQVSKALADLALQGFTEVLSLSGNPATDFRKFVARNPDTEAAVFVVVGMSGESYQREIAAHFLYYDPPINPQRIIHHRLRTEDPSRTEFEESLMSLDLIPDIVQMGNVEQVERLLREQMGITPTRTIAAPNLFGKVYSINGRIMVSLRVEPQLYADRAGAFLRAVQKLNPGHITVIFTGTAGALNQSLQIGDLVAPELLQQADTLHPSPVNITNLAAQFLAKYYGGREHEGMITGKGVTHGAVDTILFEDNIWFEQYQKVLTIVEQEVAHLARAAALAAHRTHLYALFKISDVLGVQDFTANETDRPEYRTPVLQGELVLEILRNLPSTISIQSQMILRTAVAQLEEQKHAIVLRFAGKVIALARETFDLLASLDPEFKKSFLEQLNLVIKTVQEGDLAGLMTRFSRLFQLYNLAVTNLITISNPVTTFNFEYDGGEPISIIFTTGTGTTKIHKLEPMARRRGFYGGQLKSIPEGEEVKYQVVNQDGKVIYAGILTGGTTVTAPPRERSQKSKKQVSKTTGNSNDKSNI